MGDFLTQVTTGAETVLELDSILRGMPEAEKVISHEGSEREIFLPSQG